MDQAQIKKSLQKCMDRVYNNAKEKFILLKSGDRYMLGDYSITKSDDGFTVRDGSNSQIYTEVSIIESAIMLCYAEQMADRSLLLRVKWIVNSYDKYNLDVIHYQSKLKSYIATKDFSKYDIINARLDESLSKRAHFRKRLKYLCINQMLKIKAVDK